MHTSYSYTQFAFHDKTVIKSMSACISIAFMPFLLPSINNFNYCRFRLRHSLRNYSLWNVQKTNPMGFDPIVRDQPSDCQHDDNSLTFSFISSLCIIFHTLHNTNISLMIGNQLVTKCYFCYYLFKNLKQLKLYRLPPTTFQCFNR